MIKCALVDKITNKVLNINIFEEIQNAQQFNTNSTEFIEYNADVHPWGPGGPQDIEIGLGWKDRLKEKLGYCIFCGDSASSLEASDPS